MKYTVILVLLVISNTLFSQKVNTDFILVNRELKDSIFYNKLEKSIKTVFFDHNFSQNVKIEDSSYFDFLVKTVLFLPKEYFTINISDIEVQNNYESVTLEFIYTIDSFSYVSSILKLPYLERGGKIIFNKTNYFNLNSRIKYLNNLEQDTFNLNILYKYEDSFCKLLEIEKPKKSLIYSFSKNPYTIFGIQYYKISFQNMTPEINGVSIVLDNKSNGFYKHEFIHYLLKNYSMNIFFAEGIPSYFAGCEFGKTYSKDMDFLAQYLKDNINDTALLRKTIVDRPSYKNHSICYQLASLVVHQLLKQNGIQNLIQNLKDKKSIFYTEDKELLLKFVSRTLNTTTNKQVNLEILKLINEK